MSLNPFPPLGRGLAMSWRFLDRTRRFLLNLLFLLLVCALLFALFVGGPRPLQKKTTLVLDLKGQLVEQSGGGVRDTLLANVSGDVKKSVQLHDVLSVLDGAARDPNISTVLVMLDDLQGGGQASMRELAAALDRFRASGKQVVAWGASYNQRQYMVAAHASQVYMHPMGMLLLDGFGHYRNYYRDALDKLGVTVNLMRVGTYKSFAEPYIANGPSPAASEAEAYLNNALWDSYTSDVEKARKLPAGQVMRDINNLPELVAASGGDIAKVALQTKLLDGLRTRDQVQRLLIQRGSLAADGKTLRQVSFEQYLARQPVKLAGDSVGVIVAAGDISDGDEPAGAIGGLSTSKLIRKAREDSSIKAIVLRIDSPGGSAFGSELIRRELELAQRAGKPVVVSMGDVAASGGYWISMASDEVIADPTTITGSIGVFAILPRADKVIDKLGIHTAGSTTTWLGDASNPLRPLDPRFGQLIQGSINHTYAEFTGRAAKARKTTPEKIDAVAQGRVWTGQQALERGLVDRVGSYADALASAAGRAHLQPGYRVTYLQPDVSTADRLLGMLLPSANAALGQQLRLALASVVGPAAGLPVGAAQDMATDLGWLSGLSAGHQPFMALTHCLCESPFGKD